MKGEGQTRDHILDEAERYLQDLGYNGFSYKSISQQLGIKNAAIHYYFPAKADLGEAVVRRFRERFERWSKRLERKYRGNEVKQLEGFISIPRSYVRREKVICPLATLEGDYEILPRNMQEQTRLLASDMHEWLTALLERGCESGSFEFDAPVADKATMIFAALQGASIIASTGTPRLFEVVTRQVKRDLGLK